MKGYPDFVSLVNTNPDVLADLKLAMKDVSVEREGAAYTRRVADRIAVFGAALGFEFSSENVILDDQQRLLA